MKSYTSKQTLLISLSICLVLTSLMFCSIFMLESEKVYADYSDLVNNPQAVVNFNQWINPGSFASGVSFTGDTFIINQSYNAGSWLSISGGGTCDIYSGHFYYIYIKQDSNYGVEFVADGTNVRNNVPYIVQANGTLNTRCYFRVVSNYDFSDYKVNCYLIDLTQMFGDDIPNLEQCSNLFISNWYAYNTGSPTSLNGLNSYAEGFNDALGTFKWQASNSAFTSAAQDVNLTDYKGTCVASAGTLTVNSVSNTTYTCCYIPFNFLVAYGTNVRFGGRFTAGTDHAMRHIYIGYYVNQQMVVIGSESISGGSWKPMNLSFTSPADLSGCYIWLDDEEMGFTIAVAEFSVLISDTYGAIQTSYDSGWTNATNYYETYYGVGGVGYNQIFNAGRISGLNDNNPYTFGYLMSSVIEAPLNAVLSIFNFEFMGYNFKNVITLILTIMLICAVIRLFLGAN